MNKYLNVLLDCEKAKHPNTGLYTFSVELARAMDSVAVECGIEPKYLIHKRSIGSFNPDRCRVKTSLDIVALFVDEPIYHQLFQGGRHFPALSKAKVVVTVHDLNFLYEKSGIKQAFYIRTIGKKLRKADALVFISEYTKLDYIKVYGEIKVPHAIIHNGCAIYTGEQIIEPRNYQPNGEFIFSIGTVLPKKNFHVLPALLHGNDLELIIAGIPSDYSLRIMEEARIHGVENRVKLIGAIDDQDKDWYYRNCKVFCFPSLAEGFGIPAIEALAYGKPTLLSRHTSLPEIGGKYAFYFNSNFDSETMRKELADALIEFEKRDVQAQIDYARSFTWEKAARAYCELYKSLI